MDKFTKTFSVVQKFDDDQQIVFGIANTAVDKSGNQVVDSQDDMIDPEDLELGAYAFNLQFRKMGVNHQGESKGELVESFVITKEKMQAVAKALGIEMPEIKAVAWWVGFFVEDEAVWKSIKAGELLEFSIQGFAERVEAK